MTAIRDGGPARPDDEEAAPVDEEAAPVDEEAALDDEEASSVDEEASLDEDDDELGLGGSDDCVVPEPPPHPANDTSRHATIAIQVTP